MHDCSRFGKGKISESENNTDEYDGVLRLFRLSFSVLMLIWIMFDDVYLFATRKVLIFTSLVLKCMSCALFDQ